MTATNRQICRDSARVKQLSQEMAALVAEMPIPVIAVYLHGSWGSEYERADSDIDLAMLAQRPLSLDERIQFAQWVESFDSVKHECDLVDLWCADTVFAAWIITGGLQLFSTGIAAERFEVKTLASYARLNEERETILQDIVQRGSIYNAHRKERSQG